MKLCDTMRIHNIMVACCHTSWRVTSQPLCAGLSEGCYEMSVGNADKGMLPMDEIRRRVQPFIDESLPIVLTQVIAPCIACLLQCIYLCARQHGSGQDK